MSQENKDVVRRWFEALSRHDLDGFAQLVAEDSVHHNTSNQGRAGARAELEYWLSAFPDASVTVEDLIAEGDRVVARITAEATHGGEFLGMPPSGKRVTAQEIDIVRIENGLIAEVWSAPDAFGILQQLGALPTEDVVEAPGS